DPFLPAESAPKKLEDVEADYILVSHGHFDHCADALTIAKRCDATIVACAEMAGYFGKLGAKTEPVNVGGAIYPTFRDSANDLKMQILAVPAPHSSTTPDGAPGGTPIGFVLSFPRNEKPISPDVAPLKPLAQTLADADAFTIYFACDAGFFSESSWIGRLGVDVAVVPIGDRYTMGPAASLDLIAEIKPRVAVPCHYGTWPPIAQNADKWVRAVEEFCAPTTALAMKVGESIIENGNSGGFSLSR
ncbi:MAG: MBL fold metallo-hydrolase, partial [Thermoguttaceae bacterium]|nr:MBL fold metallo-hydrolase [Thermoguttaceae bacterium]